VIRSNKEKYWRDRASRYSGFKWANDHEYKWTFISACDLKKSDWVLDVGCGPGIMTRVVLPLVDRVIGLDDSKEMLTQCDGEFNFMFGDARDIPFPDRTFDKVLARNVFHHMTKALRIGMGECHRVLKPGGRIIIGERTPPSDSRQVHVEYREMLRLKDERHTFTEDSLRYFLINSGFGNLSFSTFWIKGFDVREWLENSGLSDGVQAEIWDRHVNGSQEFKEASRMKIAEGNCVVDIKNLIVVGEAK
jgi:ubiquinone/menaquinone biosynthesis C-methylase UbiE